MHQPRLSTRRPAGITLLALVHFLLAVLLIPSGAIWILIIDVVREQGLGLGAETPMDLGEAFTLLMTWGKAAGWVLIVFGVLKAVSGVGLWKLKNWGRWLTIALAALASLSSLPGLASALRDQQMVSLVLGLLIVLGYGLIIWYLFWPGVKKVFAPDQPKRVA